MAGLQNTDIKLDQNWQLTQAANGDAPMLTDIDCFLQDIKLESMTQEGELFYDKDYGWSLLDFLQRDNDDLTRLEIKERVRNKLLRRPEIRAEKIETEVYFNEDFLTVVTQFGLYGTEEQYHIEVDLSRVSVEVVTDD